MAADYLDFRHEKMYMRRVLLKLWIFDFSTTIKYIKQKFLSENFVWDWAFLTHKKPLPKRKKWERSGINMPSLNIWGVIEWDTFDPSLSHLHCLSDFEVTYGCSLSGVKASSCPWKGPEFCSILWPGICCIRPAPYVLAPGSAYCPCRLICTIWQIKLSREPNRTESHRK